MGLIDKKNATIPITQQHVADTLGLSIVHTNKTLRKLANRKMLHWLDKGCEVLNEEGLSEIANWTPQPFENRPYV